MERPTDRVHRVRCKLEHAIKHQITTLEEDITPVPAVILHDVVRFCFDPEIERDQRDTADPANKVSLVKGNRLTTSTYRMTWTVNESPSGTRKQEKANMQYARKSLHTTMSVSDYTTNRTTPTHFNRITSTSCLNKSHVLYSKGSS